MDYMWINDISGIIYQYSDSTSVAFNSTGSNSDMNLCGDSGQNTTNVDSSGLNTTNILYGSGIDSNNYKSDDQLGTSMDRISDFKLEEDVTKKLEDYRKQIAEYKKKNKSINIMNNFGLDMNSKMYKDNIRLADKHNDDHLFKSLINVHKTSNENIQSKTIGKSDDKIVNDKQLIFKPIGYQRKGQDFSIKNLINSNSNQKRVNKSKLQVESYLSKKSDTAKNKQGKHNTDSKKQMKKKSEASKVVKDVTRASLKVSSNATAKVFMAFWGFISLLIQKDILFRLILGIFLGATYIAIVVAGS